MLIASQESLHESCGPGAGGLRARHQLGGGHHSTPRRDGMVATGRWQDPGYGLRTDAQRVLDRAVALRGFRGSCWLANPLGALRRAQRFTAIRESRYDSGADRAPGRRVYAAQHASATTASATTGSEGSEYGMNTTLGAGGLASARIAHEPFARRAGR